MNFLTSTYSYRTFLTCVLFIILGGFILGYDILFVGRNNNVSGDTIWLTDTSLSMTVEDISGGYSNTLTSRLDLAKSIILSGSSTFPGSHAIIGYARNAGVLLPLSQEKIYRKNIISSIQPTLVYGGSSTQDALRLVNTLYGTRNHAFHIIILTDGGDTNMGELPELPSYAHLTIVGIGTLEGGKIPLGYNNDGERRYKRFHESEVIVPIEKKNIESLGIKYKTTPLYIHDIGELNTTIKTLSPGVGVSTSQKGSFPFQGINISILTFIGSILILLGYIMSPYRKPRNTKIS